MALSGIGGSADSQRLRVPRAGCVGATLHADQVPPGEARTTLTMPSAAAPHCGPRHDHPAS